MVVQQCHALPVTDFQHRRRRGLLQQIQDGEGRRAHQRSQRLVFKRRPEGILLRVRQLGLAVEALLLQEADHLCHCCVSERRCVEGLCRLLLAVVLLVVVSSPVRRLLLHGAQTSETRTCLQSQANLKPDRTAAFGDIIEDATHKTETNIPIAYSL